MENKLVLQGKLEIKNAHIVIDGIDLANVLEHGSSVFMVVEPLPESKPQKNCGNCGRYTTFCCPTLNSPADDYACWRKKEQPKPAESQGWEQRFCEDYCRDGCKPENRRTCKQLAFIRAEIERVHAGYAPLISAIEMAFKEADFLPDGRLTRQARTVFEPIRKAEQNKHRGNK